MLARSRGATPTGGSCSSRRLETGDRATAGESVWSVLTRLPSLATPSYARVTTQTRGSSRVEERTPRVAVRNCVTRGRPRRSEPTFDGSPASVIVRRRMRGYRRRRLLRRRSRRPPPFPHRIAGQRRPAFVILSNSLLRGSGSQPGDTESSR